MQFVFSPFDRVVVNILPFDLIIVFVTDYMVIKTFLPNRFFDLLSYGTFELLYYAVAPTAMRDNMGFLSSMQIVIKYAPFCE